MYFKLKYGQNYVSYGCVFCFIIKAYELAYQNAMNYLQPTF